jgi:small redox-active disulfide protein 2
MALFGFGKKQKTGNGHTSAIKILGSGCAACNALEANTIKALTQLGQETDVEHVTDFSIIATYGVMTTPALVVDGKVLVSGRIAEVDQIVTLLKEARNLA